MLNKASDELLNQLFSDGLDEYLKPWEGNVPADEEQMIKYFELIIQYDPNNDHGHTDDALVFIPELYMNRKEYKKARTALIKLIKLTKKNKVKDYYAWYQYENYNDIGKTYYLENVIDRAMLYFKKSLEIDHSENYKAAYGLALCCRRQKQYSEARSNICTARLLKAIHKHHYPGIYETERNIEGDL